MKLGIFGDSFADENIHKNIARYPSWVEVLRSITNYDITCYGLSGSSLYYSYKLFLDNHKNFDKVVFISTNPGRITIPNYIKIEDSKLDPENLKLVRHVNSYETANFSYVNYKNLNHEAKEALVASQMFYKYLFDEDKEVLIHTLLEEEIKEIRKDIIFLKISYPRNTHDKVSLADISKREITGAGLSEELFYRGKDRRMCHFSKENNRLLAVKMIKWINEEPVVLKFEDFIIPDKRDILHLLK